MIIKFSYLVYIHFLLYNINKMDNRLSKDTTPLANRIRLLRKDLGLTLEQVAQKSGVALATLSRLENGKVQGTFRTHQRIAEALNIPLPELYRNLQEPEREAYLLEPGGEEAESFTYDDKASAVLLARQVSGKQMLPQMLLLEPGGKTALEQYPPGTERWLFGLEGRVEAAVGEKTYRIPQGGTLYFKASLPHRLENKEGAPARVLSVTSPASF